MRPNLDSIRARWDTSHDRGADDYTDEGCRVLAEAAFRDVPALLAEIERLQRGRAFYLREAKDFAAERDEWINRYANLNREATRLWATEADLK